MTFGSGATATVTRNGSSAFFTAFDISSEKTSLFAVFLFTLVIRSYTACRAAGLVSTVIRSKPRLCLLAKMVKKRAVACLLNVCNVFSETAAAAADMLLRMS